MILVSLDEQPAGTAAALMKRPAHVNRQKEGQESLLHQEVSTKAAVIGKLSLPSSVQMGSCRAMSSSPQRPGYVSWCVSAESPAPVTTALRATATPEEVFHQERQPAGSGSIPLLRLSPPEASGGETNTTFPHERLQPTFTASHRSSSALHSREKAPDSRADEGEDDDRGEGRTGNKEDVSLLHPEDGRVLLPRSSPVISRRHVSWDGGAANTSAPSSFASPSPARGSPSLDRRGRLTVTSTEDPGPEPRPSHRPSPLQEDKKPGCISVSSNLNRLLSAGLHLPFSGQQGLAEGHRGRGLTSCDAPHSSGLSTSTQHSKERRCSSIPEFSADIFKTSCELEKENAHFIVVDLVLEVLEGVKWTLTSSRWAPTHGHARAAEDVRPHERSLRCDTCTHTHGCGARDSKHRGEDMKASRRNARSSCAHTHQHTQDEEEEGAGKDEAEHQTKTLSFLSTDSGFEDCGGDTSLTPRDSLRNAEWLAQQLVLEFRRRWLPSHGPRRGRQSLRSSLQELPGTGAVAVSSGSLAEEIRLRTRMRGSLSWAPPRFQIIFTVQPSHRRSEVVALQHFLCAGCGTEVEPKYIKKLRYCEYLGRYFCDCCHSGSEAVIPGRLLSCWDFGRYPVSDFSKQLLDSVCHQPLFDLTCVGKTLYSKVKELDKFRELQQQLLGIKKLLTACRLSGRVMTEFEQLPAHLMEQPHLFSMDDLVRLKKGQLVAQARAVLHAAVDHVENCELCLARGFICEFCREKNIIFPFQSDICRRCPACRACFHKHCFVEKKCPKCARIQSRNKRPDGSTK